MNRKLRLPIILVGTIVIVWAIFSAGFATGNVVAQRGLPPPGILAGALPATLSQDADDVDFGLFWEAWNILQDNFHEGPLDPLSLREGAISGLALATGDANTIYQNAHDAKLAREHLSGSFEGVGIRVQLKDGLPFILQPLPGSPAERAGVRPNEFVLAVDGVSTEDLSMADFGGLVRGPRGTIVVLTLRPEAGEQSRDVEIERDRIVVPSVTSRRIDEIGYLRINNFSSRTSGEVQAALEEFSGARIAGLVLDLRNNPGGFLNASVDVASRFLPAGELILTQESRGEPPREFMARGGTKFTRPPMVVLVNQGTASASEIVAGALQAHGRAALLGEETYGKGSVQELHRLSDESLLRVTSGIWITPSGINLGANGLMPDELIELEGGELGSDDDVVLQRALDRLRGDLAAEPVAA